MRLADERTDSPSVYLSSFGSYERTCSYQLVLAQESCPIKAAANTTFPFTIHMHFNLHAAGSAYFSVQFYASAPI